MKRNKRYIQILKASVFALGAFLIILAGCEKYTIPGPDVDPNKPLYYTSDIAPIFDKGGCAGCHPVVHQPDLTAANAFASLTNGGYIKPDAPETSSLYKQMVNSASHKSKITEEEKLIILTWIQQGAKENP